MRTYRTFSGSNAEQSLVDFCKSHNIVPNRCHMTYNSELHYYVLFYCI